MDYTLLARQLIRAIRGKRSQNWLSLKLGFKGNQLYRWEAGQRQISWPDFLGLLKVCAHRPDDILEGALGYEGGLSNFTDLLLWLTAEQKSKRVAETLGVSHQAVGRLKRAESTPRLDQVLKLIDVFQGRLLEFTTRITDTKNIECLSRLSEERETELRIRLKTPVANLVCACLELEEYKQLKGHEKGFIAKLCDLSVSEEQRILKDLLSLGIVQKKSGKFMTTRKGLEAKSPSAYETLRLRAYWAKYSVAMLDGVKTLPKDSMFGWSVFSISDESFFEIRERLRQTYAEIVAIANSDKGTKDRVKILNLHCLDLNEFQKLGCVSPSA